MIIKQVGLQDLDKTAILFDQYRVFYSQPSNIEAGKIFLEERIAKSESVIFLALSEDEKPMGFVQLYPIFTSVGIQRKWLLNDLFVNDSFRKLGVGRALMNRAKDYAIETNTAGLVLETAIDNLKAQQLYESLGYERDQQHFHYDLDLR
ncbi:GNAT family N-acetyltransferase [Metabacillus herbersteinensis]|uniref:GNAT family N-acetyltransferase n=1 Tax=Metabacillus herbersteinensis TaxID=283816 RepID=A0ABV6GJM7_9BACI